MPTDILTTAQAAKLLGISVRTAQLLIEGGSLTSWKTPGGHRRVYRADVEALVAGPDLAPAASSALVVVVASPGRLSRYEEALRGVGECLADGHDDVHAAAIAIGARLPAVVVVDLEDGDPGRTALLRSLAANPALAGIRLLAVGGPGLASLRQLPEAVRDLLRDQAPSAGTGDPAPLWPLAANENQRLAALDRSGLVQSPPEEAFDRLTWLAGRCLDAPVALLTLLTPTRQVFKSRQGLDMAETPRSWAFCNRTILQKGVLAVENLALDPEFKANPAVAGGPAFRFYAGAPVVDADGFALGSLCVIDHVPRTLDEEQRRCLLSLAALASAEVQRRDTGRRLRRALEALNRRPVQAAGR
ncbi:excisionase family DNA-binding protein [Inquilinus sp.]|jgi:excisionase family DNA binding protein|uniref:excisionase family DNA-binding protein n=1 Tax=Inquilinus sp. TaxID=1932117 RepID=UPI0037837D47